MFENPLPVIVASEVVELSISDLWLSFFVKTKMRSLSWWLRAICCTPTPLEVQAFQGNEVMLPVTAVSPPGH